MSTVCELCEKEISTNELSAYKGHTWHKECLTALASLDYLVKRYGE